jgi:hypothetical protein
VQLRGQLGEAEAAHNDDVVAEGDVCEEKAAGRVGDDVFQEARDGNLCTGQGEVRRIGDNRAAQRGEARLRVGGTGGNGQREDCDQRDAGVAERDQVSVQVGGLRSVYAKRGGVTSERLTVDR